MFNKFFIFIYKKLKFNLFEWSLNNQNIISPVSPKNQMELTESSSPMSTQKQAVLAILDATWHGITSDDLLALRPGSKPEETTFPSSIKGDQAKEDLCRNVVEAVIQHVAELIPDTPTPVLPALNEFDVRFMPRLGWNCCTITSTDFYDKLEKLVVLAGQRLQQLNDNLASASALAKELLHKSA